MDNKELLRFGQAYKKVLNLIQTIVDSQRNDNKIARFGFNNRILILRSGGCGETSLLRYLSEHLPLESNEKDKEDRSFCVVKYYCLPIIVLGSFEYNNDILMTVITNLFSEAKKKMRVTENTGDDVICKDLLNQFEKVLKSLNVIKSERSFYTLESLNQRSDSENLREHMSQLVNRFLEYQGYGGESRLVLLMDDILMSVCAPEMLEQMRKYLEIDNLIIIVSTNIVQLSQIMQENYRSAFKSAIENNNKAFTFDVEELADKYLLKMFPSSRRVVANSSET